MTVGLILLLAVSVVVFLGFAHRVLDRMHLNDKQALVAVLLITNLMQRGLDGLWLRHEVLANNVANSETPGYKKKDLSFSSYLQNAMGPCSSLTTTNHLHIQRPNIETVQVNQDTSSVCLLYTSNL